MKMWRCICSQSAFYGARSHTSSAHKIVRGLLLHITPSGEKWRKLQTIMRKMPVSSMGGHILIFYNMTTILINENLSLPEHFLTPIGKLRPCMRWVAFCIVLLAFAVCLPSSHNSPQPYHQATHPIIKQHTLSSSNTHYHQGMQPIAEVTLPCVRCVQMSRIVFGRTPYSLARRAAIPRLSRLCS